MATTPTLAELLVKYAKEPPKKSFSLNARYMMINLFFNILGERAPKVRGGGLPSIDAAALEQMKHPFAARLIAWRSNTKALQSLANALSFVKPKEVFAEGRVTSPSDRAVFRFTTVGYDNVERAFTQPKRSIPLNLDKFGRKAFITPEDKIHLDADTPEKQAFFGALASPVEATDEAPSFDTPDTE